MDPEVDEETKPEVSTLTPGSENEDFNNPIKLEEHESGIEDKINNGEEQIESYEILVSASENQREYKLPYGFFKTASRRLTGATAGKWDMQIVSPNGQRFRSNRELNVYLDNNPTIKYDPEVTSISKPKDLLNGDHEKSLNIKTEVPDVNDWNDNEFEIKSEKIDIQGESM